MRFHRFWCAALLVVWTAAPSSFAQIVGITYDGEVVHTDEDTGAGIIAISTGLPLAQFNSLAKDPAGRLVAASTTSPPRLYEIDPITGKAQVIALPYVNDIRAMAFSPDGYLYVAGAVGGIKSNLYRLDLSVPFGDSSIKTLVGETLLTPQLPSGPLQAMEFSRTGVLWAWCSFGLVQVSTLNATVMDINGLVENGSLVQGLAFAPDETLYGIGDQLYSLDIQTGIASVVGSAGWSNVRGIAFSSKILPDLRVTSSASLGSTVHIDLDATPLLPAAIAYAPGLGSVCFPGLSLCADLGPTAADYSVVFSGPTPQNGEVQLALTVPNAPNLVGLTFYWQAYVIDDTLSLRKSNLQSTLVTSPP